MIVEIELDERDTVACNALADAIDAIGFLSIARLIRAVVDGSGLTPVGVDAALPPAGAGSERAAAQLNYGR